MAAVERIEGWRALGDNIIETIINKGDKIKDLKGKGKSEGLTPKEKKELTDEEKEVFRTAFEVDQRYIIEHAADRTPYVCQAQSVNLFLPADVHKRDLHMLHFTAWKKGVKSLYYCRSKSLQRAEVVSLPGKDTAAVAAAAQTPLPQLKTTGSGGAAPQYEECLACQ
jgi:ribonucleoside-diphosphate reductase alpha chain